MAGPFQLWSIITPKYFVAVTLAIILPCISTFKSLAFILAR